MESKVKCFVFMTLLHASAAALRCASDAECASLVGGVCGDGACACPSGQQAVAGGTACVPAAPYFWSPCVEDFQCDRLITGYTCGPSEEGSHVCQCREGFHYLGGRCWPTRDYGESCEASQECMAALRDPRALACAGGVCACADGYYRRQRGECRRIGYAAGDGCVLDADCQFPGGACDYWGLVCYDSADEATRMSRNASDILEDDSTVRLEGHVEDNGPSDLDNAMRQLSDACAVDSDCGSFLICSNQRHCICPVGYYSEDGAVCIAELGSAPMAEAACAGLFSVAGELCACPNNFFYEHHMRDCIKATMRLTDACANDDNCLTFGVASACGAPQPPWGLRECECRPELSTLDVEQQMCRLYSALGETCEAASDCLVGDLVVLCSPDAAGVQRCSCPEGTEQDGELCLTRGLGLGDQCQATGECGAEHAECAEGVCACADLYFQQDALCRPAIGGVCFEDSDCIIDNSRCQNDTGELSCQCDESFVEYNNTCLLEATAYGDACSVSVQCAGALGASAVCADGLCACADTHHHRNHYCWPVTHLFERCARTSECYLAQSSDRVVCRNDLCQCDFDFPYTPSLNTCAESGVSSISVQSSLLVFALIASMKFLT